MLQNVDLDEFTERLFSIERRLGLFSDRSAGLPWWDGVRYDVYDYLFSAVAGTSAVQPVRRSLYARTIGWIKRASLRTMLNARSRLFRYDVMVFRAPRQKKNGRPLDPGMDDLVPLCTGRVLTVSTYPHYYHLPRSRRGREAKIGAALEGLICALRSELGGAWDEPALRNLIETRLAYFESALNAYRRLFARVRPRLVLLTQNGMEKALFFAAHEAGIRVVESQHGLIGRSHPAYSYPDDVDYGDRSTFPSVFLAFSDYWIHSCFYPAGTSVSIGNDHLMIKALPPPTESGGIMFVSGDIYHDAMREWVTRLAAAIPDRQIIYKLHPNQRQAIRNIQQEFASFKNIRVIDASISARALLPCVTHVVLIQSTVALEALQAGRRLCILPLLHYRGHKDLFQLEAVTVTPTLEDLIGALDIPPDFGKSPSFFDPFDAATAAKLLRGLLAASDSGKIAAS
jgi:hypothetical protein